ncbi:MAG TPA: cobyrinate a,c-diamide synthase [Thermodesulfovibrionia bacterium]|nr:cobyrinate a,c-diamide synthase [Thermodesulfovibrionia bacterium]
MTRAFIIAGTSSRAGKTTITAGIVSLLVQRGFTVQTYKTGPDYIDPAYHQLASGRPCYNLDTWMMGKDGVVQTFYSHLDSVDFAVIEGVMGLFDGKSQAHDMPKGIYAGSTAHLACVLELPVILIVDATATAQSVGAVVLGFKSYIRELNLLAGVVFNNVAGKRHYELLLEGVMRAGIPVIGYLPKDTMLNLPERHLGLLPPEENAHLKEMRQRLGEVLDSTVNMPLLMSLTKTVTNHEAAQVEKRKCHNTAIRIGIALDEAFWFYYQENFDILKKAGMELVFFSPLKEQKVPAGVNALYFGGGYPEIYAESLSGNTSMMHSIRQYAYDGGCIYAECGGFMLLTEGMYNLEGNYFEMAGLFKTRTKMSKTHLKLGYREVELLEDMPLGRRGERLRGHEFHYSHLESAPENAQDIYNNDARGFRIMKVFASYVHVHFGSRQDVGEHFACFLTSSDS